MRMCVILSARVCDVLIFLQPISNADFVVPVEIDGVIHQVYVLKRPHVDEFLQSVGKQYECVLFTASLAKVWVMKKHRINLFQVVIDVFLT